MLFLKSFDCINKRYFVLPRVASCSDHQHNHFQHSQASIMSTVTTKTKPAAKAAPKKAPLKRTQSTLSFDPPASKSKRVCLGDVTARFTAQELEAEEKEDIVAHVIALQEHLSTLTSKSSPVKEVEEMTPEQLKAKVEVVRRMLRAGLASQMKVSPHHLDL
jgi:hypothetical protein